MGRKLPPRAPSKQIQVEVEFYELPEGEDNERIERLTRKILRLLENSSQEAGIDSAEEPARPNDAVEEIFGSNFEDQLGI